MELNCKPGQMAVVVKVIDPSEQYAVGAVLRVIDLFSLDPPFWTFEPLSRNLPPADQATVLDAALRPLPDDPEHVTEDKEETIAA